MLAKVHYGKGISFPEYGSKVRILAGLSSMVRIQACIQRIPIREKILQNWRDRMRRVHFDLVPAAGYFFSISWSFSTRRFKSGSSLANVALR